MGDMEMREVAEAIKNAARAMREEHRPTQAFEAMRVRDRQLAKKILALPTPRACDCNAQYELDGLISRSDVLALLLREVAA